MSDNDTPSVHNPADKKPGFFKTKMFLLILSLLISLLVAEALMRGYYAYTHKIIGADEEEVCLRDTIRMVSNEDNPARFYKDWPAHEYWNYSGVRPQANFDFDLEVTFKNGDRIIIYDDHTNAQHTRNLANFSLEKPLNKTRIIALGDSFTWGDDVPLLFSYPSILEKLISDSEVINMGIRATGVDNMYLRWKYDALQYDPDIVLYTIYIDDIGRARPCIYKPKFEIEGGELVITNLPPPSLLEIFETQKEPKLESYLAKHIMHLINYPRGVSRYNYEYGLERLNLFLDEMHGTSKEKGTYFLVALITDSPNPQRTRKEQKQWDEVIEATKSMLQEKGVPYVDSAEIFIEEKYDLHSQDHYLPIYAGRILTHFTGPGNGYFAQGIKKKLEREGVIRPQIDYDFVLDGPQFVLYLKNRQNASKSKVIVPYVLLESVPPQRNSSAKQ